LAKRVSFAPPHGCAAIPAIREKHSLRAGAIGIRLRLLAIGEVVTPFFSGWQDGGVAKAAAASADGKRSDGNGNLGVSSRIGGKRFESLPPKLFLFGKGLGANKQASMVARKNRVSRKVCAKNLDVCAVLGYKIGDLPRVRQEAD